jgi:3-dehydroquinate synthase/shikimate kinase/3-dehydroquinate synthase
LIVLIGFMGAGKTTVGSLVARELRMPFIDTDRAIEQRTGMSIPELFENKGEPYFRDVERQVVASALSGPPAVVALGGGAPEDPSTSAVLEWNEVIHLEVSFPEVLRRLKGDGTRPLLQADPRALYEERVPLYRRIAKMAVATDERTPAEIASQIAEAHRPPTLKAKAHGRPNKQVVTLSLGPRSYEITVGRDLLSGIRSFLPLVVDMEKVVLVTHRALRGIADDVGVSFRTAGHDVHTVELAEGETSKSLVTVETLLHRFAELAVHRTDLIVAVGGGVICDITGFVASIYVRGLRVAHVPTSLLAQVDASIGGKTGINLPYGKNLAGTIHQPIGVICDVDVLKSLPEPELRAGLAEVAKYGFIAQPQLLDLLVERSSDIINRDLSVLEEIVFRSAHIKASVVAADETEQGERAFLNYGHTFGHALEHAAAFSGIRHGEAVALGMMAAAYLAEEMGWLDAAAVARHRTVLEALGLPVTAKVDIDHLEGAWLRDKKYRKGVRFVLLASIGRPRAGVIAERPQLLRALERMAQ